MREVGIVSFAQSAVARDDRHNETEMLVPTIHAAIDQSGIAKDDLGFVCSGSFDYLQGGPFAFVSGLDSVGAWPPIRESHVEMDSAWALYEAWVAIQTGEVDSALVYGFGKSSPGDLHEIMTLQYDPYYVVPLWPSMVDVAAMQARAYMEESGRSEEDLAEVAARAQRNGKSNPHAIRTGDLTAAQVLAQPVTHDPLRDADIAPITDGTAAVVIAAGDLARSVCERPAWIRAIEHRIEAHSLGVRDLTQSESTRAAAVAAGTAGGAIDVAELHAQFSHEELMLAEAIGLNGKTQINPSGGPLASNPVMSAGLVRIGEVARRIWTGDVQRGVAHATSGPCLQQNMVCVLEGDDSAATGRERSGESTRKKGN
jgi:acetyl-CoA acetyltransferase